LFWWFGGRIQRHGGSADAEETVEEKSEGKAKGVGSISEAVGAVEV